MQNVIYLLLRRMRMPLIAVIMAYAVSTLGLVLIPGADNEGNAWRMDFFHAFYFVSFMGSTIGFGEIPYPFTDAQRLWTTAAMYGTVIAWLYAIGAMFSLIQDAGFRRAVGYVAFTRSVRRLHEPFYLVCGMGDTGALLVQELAVRGIRTVAIDWEQSRIHNLLLQDLPCYVPGLCADARNADNLIAAGIKNRECAGVIALTNVDHTNLKIAITSKLISPRLQVICRSEYHDSQANMASFGTDHIINPFDTFAERFAMMFQSPSMFLVYEWMTSIREAPLQAFVAPPQGDWVICGYGRFGKALNRSLSFEGLQTVIIEADVNKTNAPKGTIEGRGTEAITLYEADIENAVGIIAGTDDDANNLSIIITALGINKNLFTIARQNLRSDDAIFRAAHIDIIMQPGTIISQRIVDLLTTPLLTDFLRLARQQSDEWANVLVSRVVGILADRPPDSWTITLSHSETPAVLEMLGNGCPVTIKSICTDPRDPTLALPCVPLFMKRQHEDRLLPGDEMELQAGDQILFCGHQGSETHMRWAAANLNALNYICTGEDRPSGIVWRWLSERRAGE